MFKTFVAIAFLAIFLPAVSAAGPVNVNTADARTISEELKGIGLSKARAIVDYRQKHGPFKRAEDLSLVKGIGEKTVNAIKSDVLVEDPPKK